MINKQMQKLGESRSVIRELFEYGKALAQKTGAENVFDFTIGNPAVKTPDAVTEAAIAALKTPDVHAYTSAQGDLAARKSICQNIYSRYGYELDPELVYLTCGAAAALAATLRAVCSSPSDTVVINAPYFPEYKVFIANANASVLEIPAEESSFGLNLAALDSGITPEVCAVIVNSPNNPSGTVYGEDSIKNLAELLENKQKKYGHAIYLIIDEPYREIVFDNAECPFVPKYYKNSIVCYSYSKSLSLPGERIGYVAVSPEAEDKTAVYSAITGAARSMGYVCAPSLFQKVIASCAGLVSDQTLYKNNRDTIIKNLTELGFKAVNPRGAFYIMMKTPIADASEFSEYAKQLGLLLVPSDSFGVKGYVRIATCVPERVAAGSYAAFKKLAEHYKQ